MTQATTTTANPPVEAAQIPESQLVHQDTTPGAITTGGGITFDFVFNGVTYTVQVYAPDKNQQYGFAITQATTTIASLIYKDDVDWQIAVGLPDAFKVDGNLTINKMNVNIAHGTVQPLS